MNFIFSWLILSLFGNPDLPTETSMWTDVVRIIQETEDRRSYMEKTYGTPYYTTLTIKDYSIDVYNAVHTTNSTTQKVVDAKYSAAYFTFDDNTFVIGDHVNQGFSVIKELKEGDEISLGEDIYVVKGVDLNAINRGELIYSDGSSAVYGNDKDLILYTCNSQKPYVTIVSCIKEEKGE